MSNERREIEVFADVWCPFAHIGLRTVVAELHARKRDDVDLVVRAWPLELVNGVPMDPAKTAKEILKDLMPAVDDHTLDLMQSELPSLRVVYKQEVLKLLDIVEGEGTKFFEISYMRSAPGKTAAYENLEKNVFKTLHAERKSQGAITAWAFWQLVYPASGIRDYDYVTVNGINDWDKFINSDYGDIYKKVFPSGDINKLTAQTQAARTIVKTEVWKRELRVSADGK